MKCLTDLDMEKNQILNTIIHKVSSDPVTVNSNNKGMIIYNTTDNKLKYYNGIEWISIGSGDDSKITIDSILSDSSTNDNVAGSKAVVDYVKIAIRGLTDLSQDIESITNDSVLKKNNHGAIIGCKVDSSVQENSNNLITSGAVFNAIETINEGLHKIDEICPVITSVDGITCKWEIELNHTKPCFVQVYDSSNEVITTKIQDTSSKIIITFKGIGTRISAGSYHAVIIYSE